MIITDNWSFLWLSTDLKGAAVYRYYRHAKTLKYYSNSVQTTLQKIFRTRYICTYLCVQACMHNVHTRDSHCVDRWRVLTWCSFRDYLMACRPLHARPCNWRIGRGLCLNLGYFQSTRPLQVLKIVVNRRLVQRKPGCILLAVKGKTAIYCTSCTSCTSYTSCFLSCFNEPSQEESCNSASSPYLQDSSGTPYSQGLNLCTLSCSFALKFCKQTSIYKYIICEACCKHRGELSATKLTGPRINTGVDTPSRVFFLSRRGEIYTILYNNIQLTVLTCGIFKCINP